MAAISVDPPEVSRNLSAKLGYTFPILSDSNADVIRRYDLLHPHAGPEGHDISRPAEFLIDANGVVSWLNLTESILVRARPEQMLKEMDRLAK